METILAIDPGKNKSVFYEMDRGSLKTKLNRKNKNTVDKSGFIRDVRYFFHPKIIS